MLAYLPSHASSFIGPKWPLRPESSMWPELIAWMRAPKWTYSDTPCQFTLHTTLVCILYQCHPTHGASRTNRATLLPASVIFSEKICGMLHHPCGCSSYSTSSTATSSAARRFSSSCDASLIRSAEPTRISVFGQDAVKGKKAPETSGSVHATPGTPTYVPHTTSNMGTERMQALPCALARSFGLSKTWTTSGEMPTIPPGAGWLDCKMRCVNTIAVRYSQSTLSVQEHADQPWLPPALSPARKILDALYPLLITYS